MAGINTIEEANRFLRERYINEFNCGFMVKAAERGTAFRRPARTDLEWVFTIQTERVVAKDNTVAIGALSWQIDETRFRHTLAGCAVTIHDHLNGDISIRYGPYIVARFGPQEERRGKVESPNKRRACHFPTATTTGTRVPTQGGSRRLKTTTGQITC